MLTEGPRFSRWHLQVGWDKAPNLKPQETQLIINPSHLSKQTMFSHEKYVGLYIIKEAVICGFMLNGGDGGESVCLSSIL